jgi:RND family efflux transporter MFP subunit
MPPPLARRRFSAARRLFGAAVLSWLVGAGAACSQRESTRLEHKPPPHVRAVSVVEVAPRPKSRHLVRLEPARRARLAPRGGGEVTGIEVIEQQEVQAGALLVRFAGDASRGGLMTAKASIARIEESLRDNARELGTARALLAKNIETTRAVEQLETERARLEAQLREAKGTMVQARDQVGATAIVAPFTGTVTRIDTEVGEYMAPGAVALVLAQLDPLAVEVPLTQDEVALYDEGGLTFQVLARGRTLDAELEWLASEADEGTSTFRARLRVPNPQRTLRAGELVDVEVLGSERAKLTAVPMTAVRWQADQSYVLRIAEGDKVEQVDVRVLEDADGLVAIAGDLRPGDRVVATGPTALLAGDAVVVVEGAPRTLAAR